MTRFLEALGRDLEAARYAAKRAWKQYDASDPENRLVAAELEQRWNQALGHVPELEGRIERHGAQAPEGPAPRPEDFEALAEDLEALWQNPATEASLRKGIVRTLIKEVVAEVDAEAGEIILVIHWIGGVHTELRLPRRRRGQRNSTSKETVAAVRQLVMICNDDMIAGLLNRNGLRTGPGNRWTRERVTSLRSTNKIPRHCPERQRSEGWMNLTQAAAFLGVSQKTLRLATARGEIESEHPLGDGPWLFNRAPLQSQAADQLVKRARRRGQTPAGPSDAQQDLLLSST